MAAGGRSDCTKRSSHVLFFLYAKAQITTRGLVMFLCVCVYARGCLCTTATATTTALDVQLSSAGGCSRLREAVSRRSKENSQRDLCTRGPREKSICSGGVLSRLVDDIRCRLNSAEKLGSSSS